jgi:hypothetical protein
MNTTKATHTPGPWSVLDGAIVSEKLNDYGNFIVCAIQRELTEQDRANLSLIASAPELLEEAKDDLAAFEASFEHNAHETPSNRTSSWSDAQGWREKKIARLRAAIAKATEGAR